MSLPASRYSEDSCRYSRSARVGGRADNGFEHVAEIADHPHVLALEAQVCSVHLDELLDEDASARIGFILEPLDIGDRRADQVVHELKLAADRSRQSAQLGMICGLWCCGE